MKKLLFLCLLMTLALLSALAEGTPTPPTPTPTVSFSLRAEPLPDEAAAEAILTLTISNPTGETLREVSLFAQEAGFVPDFSFVDVPAGESIQWTGSWPLTGEDIARRNVTVYGHYRAGKSYDDFSVTVTLIVEPTLLFENGVITGYTGDPIDLVIPSEIDGQQVVAIGDEAFFEAFDLQRIVIPEGVTSIGSHAFFSCYMLESVTLPSTLKELGNSAFAGCDSLAAIALPDSAAITGINPFRQSGIQEIIVSENHPTLVFTDGFLIEKNTGILIAATGEWEHQELVIPEGVTEIGSYAITDFRRLTSVKLPSTLKIIRSNAFFRCEDLADVSLPEGLTTLEDLAFMYCCSLEYIYLPQSLTEIDGNPFLHCEGLKQLFFDLMNPTFVLMDGAFFDLRDGRLLALLPHTSCWAYDSWEWAEAQKRGITEWVSPSHITSVAPKALSASGSVEKIVLSAQVTEISRFAFWRNSSVREVVVEGPVAALPEYAFAYCYDLECITLPSTIAEIDETAFLDCSEGLVFICEADSYAAQWAEAHGYAWHE